MPESQDIDIDVQSAPYPPVPATVHLKTIAPRPVHQRVRRQPPAMWRVMLASAALIVAAPVGIAAADPAWNGADLAVLIVLAMFVAAFAPGKDRA